VRFGIDESVWKRIQLNGMAKDYSWKVPAGEYARLYEAAWVSRHPGQAPPKSAAASRI
jgi:glycogen synthase